jgi:hypothetical protein
MEAGNESSTPLKKLGRGVRQSKNKLETATPGVREAMNA